MKEVRTIERRGESEPGVRPVAAKKGPPICNRETENHRDVTPTFPLAKTGRGPRVSFDRSSIFLKDETF